MTKQSRVGFYNILRVIEMGDYIYYKEIGNLPISTEWIPSDYTEKFHICGSLCNAICLIIAANRVLQFTCFGFCKFVDIQLFSVIYI